MSAEPLFSAAWYRVAALRPRLRAGVELRRQDQRGVAWYVLLDAGAEALRRLSRPAYAFVGRCDGATPVERIWERLLAAQPEASMTQDEVVRLLAALHERRLIEFDDASDVESIFRTRRARRRAGRWQGANPLAFRVPLGDPTAWLVRLEGLGRRLFTPGGLLLWALLVALAALVAAPRGAELGAHAARLADSPRGALGAWLLYPLVKAVHELAHGLAVRRWGGTVRETGVVLMLLTPVPFVDATSADGFRQRGRRAAVSAAGILAETALAAAALLAWTLVEPGWTRDAALLTVLIGAVSTLLVNGNPLLRYDGYYLLCDAFDLRNLGLRSAAWWLQQLGRRVGHVGHVGPARPIEPLPGERKWLVAYAPLATVYRAGLSVGVALWIGHASALLGAAAASMMLWHLLLRPMARIVRAFAGAADAGGSLRPAARAALAAGAVAAAAVWTPLPFATRAEGVVWPSERAQLRAGADGFVERFLVADGAPVRAGELVATLADERLLATRAQLVADASGAEVALFQAIAAEPDQVPALREKLAYVQAEAARNDERLARLEVRAHADGVLVVPHAADAVGRWMKQGEMVGYLMTGEPLTVRVALPQDDADLLRGRPDGAPVGVRLAEDGWARRAGRIARDLDGAVPQLPSAALGERFGGAIPTDPADAEGLRPLSPVVLVDVEVPDARDAPGGAERIGARAAVRFDHGTAPLARQLARQARQLLLRHVDPGA